MKTKYLFLAALSAIALTSCTSEDFVGLTTQESPATEADGAIKFGFEIPNMTRAAGDPFVGATAAEKLGGMFVVEGTKGSEQTNSPSTTVVFDNYLVLYEANSAGKTESNTHNWEYVNKQTGITNRLNNTTWGNLHSAVTTQSIKYWDYSTDQYDFIAWSTGEREAVTDAAVANSKVKVTRINTGTDLSSTGKGGFTMTVANVTDLMKCYYTDIVTVPKANYGAPVTLTFRNMAAKVRVALYETVPGYSVQDVKFYSADDDTPATPDDLGTNTSATATLFTTGDDKLPQSGSVLVYYPHIGTTHRNAPQTTDYNKASVSVTADAGTAVKTQGFGTFPSTTIGTTLPDATFAGTAAEKYYTAVFPNSTGKALTLRVDYTLVSTDGSAENIKVYGAKAVVPATYTEWQPNYAYTYIFKISDNSNGWTTQTATVDNQGLYPITFDAVVASFIDVNAEQTTVTTVATPSITTYQQGHTKANNEYSNAQLAGVDQTNVKKLYVQVMNNNAATPSLVNDLSNTNSLLYHIDKKNDLGNYVDYEASEAEVMDALQNRTNTPTGEGTDPKFAFNDNTPLGRNSIKLTKNSNIANDVEKIVNGVDDQPITVTAHTAAAIDIAQLAAGTYAYVYASTVPSTEKKVYNVVSISTDTEAENYYEIDPSNISSTACAADAVAIDGNVYFVKNVDANGGFVSWTFKQTKVGENVSGLYLATILANKANKYTAGHFYFDVYYQNNGKYAVKVIKVVN